MSIDIYWHMCPLWYFHGRSCIPNASCRNLFLWDLEIFLLVWGSPILKGSWKNPKFFAPKKLAPASWRSWNSSPPQNLDPPMLKTMKKLSCVLFFAQKNHQIPSWTLPSSFFVWRFRSLRLKLLPLLFSWAYHSVPVPWPNSLVLSAKIKRPGTTIPSYNHLVEFFPELRGYDFWMVHKKWSAKEMLKENSQKTLQKPSNTFSVWKSSIFQVKQIYDSESTGSVLCFCQFWAHESSQLRLL